MDQPVFPLPPNEAERLAALREYRILDTPPEAAFDDLARLSAQICGTPVAIISFVDEQRIWLKARVGMEVREMPRDLSLCSAAILQPDLFVIEDLTQHPVFAGHPLVCSAEGLRFFASMPLRTPEGFALGGLCVLDYAPRQLRPEQLEALEILGRQVVVQLELRRNLARLEVINSEHVRTEAALRTTEEKYREIFENVVEGIFQTTPEGHYISANPKLAQIYGYASPAELMAAVQDISGQLYLNPNRRAAFADQIRRAGEVVGFESQIRRKDGSVIWISENARAVRGADGLIRCYEGTVEDITDRKRAEEALRESEVLYHSLVECLPQCIFRKDTQGRFTFVNSLFCQTIKRLPQDVLGRTDVDLFSPEMAEKYREDDHRVMASGVGIDTIEEHVQPSGTKLYVHVVKTALSDAAGQVTGVQGIFWDETERRRIEQQLAYERDLLQALLDNVPDAIYFKDRNSRFLRASRALSERVGVRDPLNLAGKTDFDFFDNDHAKAAYADEQRIIRTGQPVLGITEREVSPDGTVRYVLSSKLPLHDKDGHVIGTFGISKDVTTLVLAEEELKRARDSAVETAQLKAQFLANMSHEIRTPMNAIMGMTGLLLDSQLTPDQRDFAETVRRSADALLSIINSILDFSKLDAGRLKLETVDFDLRETVEATTELLAGSAQSKGVELIGWVHEDLPCAVRGDPSRLRQVLTNLIGNAIKFTERGEVVVEVSPELETDNQVTVRFEVRDTGIGIAPEAQARIYEPFAQADGSTTRRYGGTGLGLSISRQLVDLLGGKLGLVSRPGFGSTFWFEISLPRQGAVTPDEKAAALAGKRILVVDDNATHRAMLLDRANYWGMRAVEATNAPDGMSMMLDAAVAGDPFDLALIDVEMPGTDGLILAESIKSEPKLDHTRLVMLSSLSSRLDMRVMVATGVCACLVKPTRRARLRDTLVRVLAAPQATPGMLIEQSAVEVRPASDSPEARSIRGRLRVLVAEDNLVNQKLALRQLHKVGCPATAVSNGKEAIAALDAGKYDVLLLDCQMPEMDGYETARRIRQREEPGTSQSGEVHAPLYIIAMTANAMDGDREKCLVSGMDDYVSKPVQIADLESALRRADLHLLPAAPSAGSVPPAASATGSSGGAASPATIDELPRLDQAIFGSLHELGEPGETDPVRELVDLFHLEVGRALDRLRHAVTAADAPAVKAAAHNIKGCSNNLGARRLAALASMLEQSAKAGDLGAAAASLVDIETEYARVGDRLAAELAKPAPAA